MAGVIKEYRCLDCNRIFDSNIPVCIHCGSTNIERIFTQPFAFKSDKTKSSDNNLEHLTSSYGLTDFSNNENTKHTPNNSQHWMATEGSEVSGLLPSVAGGSFPVKDIKGKAAGRYQATVHAEDKVGI